MPLTGCFERRLYDKPVALFGASSRSTYAQASLAETLKVMAARMIGEASITVPLLGRNLHGGSMVATNSHFECRKFSLQPNATIDRTAYPTIHSGGRIRGAPMNDAEIWDRGAVSDFLGLSC